MGQPELARWVFTALFAGITLTCLARLLTGPARGAQRPGGMPARHDDLGHVVMGLGMIAMVLSWTNLLPESVWVVLFGGQAVFFTITLLRHQPSDTRSGDAQRNWEHTHHMVGSLGMLYMVVAMGGVATGGMVMTGMSPLAVSFGVYFLAYGVWSGLRAVQLLPERQPVPVGAPESTVESAAAVPGSGLPAVLSRPLLVHGCRALMGGGMAYLLLAS